MFLLGAAIFLAVQWRRLGDAPVLEVTSLENLSIVTTPITVTGKTEPNTTVTINTEIVSLDPQGRFRYELNLPPGERTVVVQATDSRGRQNEAVYFVTVE